MHSHNILGCMSMTKEHYLHLDMDARVLIENSLCERRSFTWMADKLGISTSSVSREVQRNRRDDGFPSNGKKIENKCAHATTCSKHKACDPDCLKKCSICQSVRCSRYCKDYELYVCIRTDKAPWVCNGCISLRGCRAHHWRYVAKTAQGLADVRLIESRQGLDMTGHEMIELAEVMKKGLALNQSVHHIFASHPDLPCSERSFYRHVENEDIAVPKMDLRKKVKYKKRSHTKVRESKFYLGHEYSDYLDLCAELRQKVVQMDCVESVAGDLRAILTLTFIALHCQIMIVLKRKTKEHVVAALNWIETLCKGPFSEFFSI